MVRCNLKFVVGFVGEVVVGLVCFLYFSFARHDELLGSDPREVSRFLVVMLVFEDVGMCILDGRC